MSFQIRMTSVVCAALAAMVFVGLDRARGGVVDCETLDTIDGLNLQTKYSGATNTVQDNATGFGNRAPVLPNPTTGSELDQLFIRNDANTLFIGLTGNLPPSDDVQNSVIVFIETDGTNPSTVLNTSGITGSEALKNMHGVTLDFAPNYAITLWNYLGVQTALLHNVSNPNDVGVTLSIGTQYAVNNLNLVGVNDEAASDPLQQQLNAPTASSGFEFAIPLNMIGYTAPLAAPDDIKVHALIVNAAGYISNQSLPPLVATSGSTGGNAGCIGIHDPLGTPPNNVSFSTQFASQQFANFSMLPGNTGPSGTRDGLTIPSDFGAAVSTQNNHTCFGDAHAFSPSLTPGSEIDQLFVASDAAKLYIGITGNVPINDSFNNTIVVFVDLGDFSGINPLADGQFYTGGSGTFSGLGELELQQDFFPRYAIQYWRQNGQHRATVQDLSFGFDNVVAMEFTTSALRHLNPSVNAFGVNLQNQNGVNNIAGDDPVQQTLNAVTAANGVQFSLNLNEPAGSGQTPGQGLGYNIGANPGIKIVAAVISGSGFMSNQWLPPLRKTTGEVRTSVDTMSTATPITDADVGNDPATIASNLTATDAATQGLERVTALEVSVNITHPEVGDLTIDLFNAASNRTVRLWDGDQAGVNMTTTFKNGATTLTAWVAPGAGQYDVHDPVNNSLLTFNDIDPIAGEWTLFVTDSVTGNAGTLNSWTLSLREDVGGGVDCLGFRTDSDPPVSIADDFPTAEVITVDPLVLVGTGAPVFSGVNPPGSNIPAQYSAGPLATQNNYACFGDAQDPGLQFTPGSEMDQLWVTNSTDRLQFAISGNLELNSNAFVVLLDTKAGGESTLAGNPTPPRPVGGGANQTTDPGLNGAVLDPCMVADYALSVQSFGDGSYVCELTDLQLNTSKLLGYQNMNSGSGVLRAPGNNAGSELDQMFIKNDASNLYIGLTGNLEGNGNGIIILLDTVPGGSNVINTTGSTGWPTPLAGTAPTAGNNGLNGDTLPASFAPEWALVAQRTGNAFVPAKLVNLTNVGSTPVNITYVTNETVSPNTYAANNGNTAGINGNPVDATQATLAPSATTGYQFAISRASLNLTAPGSDGVSVNAVAFITGNTGYWSNQALPPFTGDNINNVSSIPVPPADDPIDVSTFVNTFTYVLAGAGGYFTPASYNGTAIPSFMGTAVATQDNFTQFGDQGIDPRYNNDNCALVAFTNENSGGVTGCSQAGSPPNCTGCNGGAVGDAANVDTGMEVDLSFEDLGIPSITPGGGPTVKLLGLVTGSTGYASNQFLPGLGGGKCNQAFGPNINLTLIAGDQCLPYTLQEAVPCGANLADINGDNQVNATDISVFVQVLLGNNTDPCPLLKADVNPAAPLGINGNDIKAFVEAYLP